MGGAAFEIANGFVFWSGHKCSWPVVAFLYLGVYLGVAGPWIITAYYKGGFRDLDVGAFSWHNCV